MARWARTRASFRRGHGERAGNVRAVSEGAERFGAVEDTSLRLVRVSMSSIHRFHWIPRWPVLAIFADLFEVTAHELRPRVGFGCSGGSGSVPVQPRGSNATESTPAFTRIGSSVSDMYVPGVCGALRMPLRQRIMLAGRESESFQVSDDDRFCMRLSISLVGHLLEKFAARR